jgi:prepilin-type N-terminal cleavage/methylation domain-containing protein
MIEMKKLNNKGFSLVELIIVIAIMAILVGVVGTQVIPYLEKSRQGKDMQVFSAWNTAGMSAYSMNADKVDSSSDLTFTITDSGVVVANGSIVAANKTSIEDTFKELTGIGSSNVISGVMVSREGKKVTTVVITVPAGGAGASNITTNPQDSTGVTVAAFGVIENK